MKYAGVPAYGAEVVQIGEKIGEGSWIETTKLL